MLAPCWLHVGSCWLHVGSCWTKWPPRWLEMPLCWLRLASRWPTWPPIANFDQFLIRNCSFWNPLDPQNIEKSIGFTGPFAFCTFLFLLMVFEPLSCLKLAPSWLKLAYLSKFEPKLSQVGSKLAQVGSKLGPSWLHVGSCWAHVGDKLAPSKFKLMLCWSQYLGTPFDLAQAPPRTPPRNNIQVDCKEYRTEGNEDL